MINTHITPVRRKSFRAPLWASCLLVAGLLSPVTAGAESQGQNLTLEEAVSRTLASHAELRAQGAMVAASERRAAVSSLTPPLVVGADVENVAGSGDLEGVQGSETTLRISRVIELGGKRAARIALGDTETERRRLDLERARIDLTAETARRFLAVLQAQYEVDLAKRGIERAEAVESQVKNAVAAGRKSEADTYQAEIALGLASLDHGDAEHELVTARLALATLWGERQPGFGPVAGSLELLPDTAPLASLADGLGDTIEQRSLILEAAGMDARRRLAATGGKPDLSLSAGVRHLEGVGDQALVFGVSMPLGTASRAALEAAAYEAELSAVGARREAAELDVYQRLFSLYQELEHARHVVEVHDAELIPKAERALAANRKGYEQGSFSFLTLSQAQQQVAELRAARLAAAARYHALLIDIERLTAISGVTTP